MELGQPNHPRTFTRLEVNVYKVSMVLLIQSIISKHLFFITPPYSKAFRF